MSTLYTRQRPNLIKNIYYTRRRNGRRVPRGKSLYMSTSPFHMAYNAHITPIYANLQLGACVTLGHTTYIERRHAPFKEQLMLKMMWKRNSVSANIQLTQDMLGCLRAFYSESLFRLTFAMRCSLVSTFIVHRFIALLYTTPFYHHYSPSINSRDIHKNSKTLRCPIVDRVTICAYVCVSQNLMKSRTCIMHE